MSEKTLNNIRIVNKHDTDANWLKATGFTPKQGELIVYDIDENYSYERIKIGDGVHNVNDLPFYSGSWEDLANKPFWSEGSTIVEWDGDTTGLAVSSDGTAYKVSDLKPNLTEVIGGKLTFSNGNVVEVTSDIIEGQGYIISIYYGSVLINTTNGSAYDYDLSVTLQEPGIYFQKNTYNQLVSFSYGNETIYYLDEKYIPNTIARVSDVESLIDVSGQIGTHNISETAHSDIRTSINDLSNLVGDEEVIIQINNVVDPVKNEIDTIKVQISDLLYKAIQFTSFTNNVGTVEIGSTVNTVTLSWTTNKIPTALTLDNNSIDVNSTSYTYSNLGLKPTSVGTTSYTIKATDERDATATKNTSISFVNGVYYGAIDTNATLDSSIILSMSKKLQNSIGVTFTKTPGTTEHLAYALPSRLGTPTFTVGVLQGGFFKKGTIDFTNASGYTEPYDVYYSTNVNLGETKVVVS